jgi:hypothetical protein
MSLASVLIFFNRRIILERTATLRLSANEQWPIWQRGGGPIGRTLL